MLTVTKTTAEHIPTFTTWKYPSPYNIYDLDSDEFTKIHEFYTVLTDSEIVGFFRLMNKGDFIMVGLGLSPEHCGKGVGSELMECIKHTAQSECPNMVLRLEVRTFNERARKCYERAGFAVIKEHNRNTPTGLADFYLMELAR